MGDLMTPSCQRLIFPSADASSTDLISAELVRKIRKASALASRPKPLFHLAFRGYSAANPGRPRHRLLGTVHGGISDGSGSCIGRN